MTVTGRHSDLAVLAIVAANALAGPVRSAIDTAGLPDALLGLMGISPVIWTALALGFLRMHRDGNAGQVAAWPMLLAALVCLIPSAQASWSAGAGYFALRAALSGSGATAGQLIALAVCARGPATWLLTTLFAEPLLRTDAVLSGWLAGWFTAISAVEGNIVVHESGHRLFVMTGCSSLNNLSLALLFWFAVTRGLADGRPCPPVWHGVMVAALVVLINVGRLAVMAISPDSYHWLHDGQGATVVAALTAMAVALVTIFSLGGTRDAYRPA